MSDPTLRNAAVDGAASDLDTNGGPRTLHAIDLDHSLRAIAPGHTLKALEQGAA